MQSSPPQRRQLSLAYGLSLVIALPATPLIGHTAADTGVDPRRVYDSDAPSWLQAVGQLRIPGSDYHDGRLSHRIENCSATLVTTDSSDTADTIITAWHCLETYRDLSRPITFTLQPDSPDSIVRRAHRVADGGGMHADWAVLQLQRPIPSRHITALTIHPGRADSDRLIVMAGFSRDTGIGQGGKELSFDPRCSITEQSNGASGTDCVAFKGASGGAVVQYTASGRAQLCGVISQGDGAGRSTFVPIQQFRSQTGYRPGH